MRTLAILLTALLSIAGILVLTSTSASPSYTAIAAGLAVATVVAAGGYWRGARWGALLLVVVGLFGAFFGQADHSPLELGPIIISSRPTLLFGILLAVVVVVALSWRGLGKR